jgi:hypothetical protein
MKKMKLRITGSPVVAAVIQDTFDRTVRLPIRD